MRKTLRFLALLLALPAVGWCVSAPPSARLRVLVMDDLGRPVAAAKVVIRDAKGLSRSLHYDKIGVYESGTTTSGAYDLTVEADGYATVHLKIKLPSSSPICIYLSPSANMVKNPGFEEEGSGGPREDEAGVGASWETICGGRHPEIYDIDGSVVHSGKRAQRMTCKGYNCDFGSDPCRCFDTDSSGQKVFHPVQGIKLGNQAIAQAVEAPIVPGEEYQLSAWVRIKGLSQSWEWFRLGIYWLDKDGRFIGESRESDADKGNVGTHDWRLVTAKGVAPQGAAKAKLYLHHHFEHGIVWYDDVCFAKTKDIAQ